MSKNGFEKRAGTTTEADTEWVIVSMAEAATEWTNVSTTEAATEWATTTEAAKAWANVSTMNNVTGININLNSNTAMNGTALGGTILDEITDVIPGIIASVSFLFKIIFEKKREKTKLCFVLRL